MKIFAGINGFGRIGKCTFLQLLEDSNFSIKVINTSLDINLIENYLNNDTNHGRRNYNTRIIDDDKIEIGDNIISIINIRKPENIRWREYGVKYLFETTGVFLTKEELLTHDVDYVILSSPPSDEIPIFCYGVNHHSYEGEKIISTGSCTTNCLSPMINICDNINKIEFGSFITIHSTTSSQNTVDKTCNKKRTTRSVFNNIIPHTTGASKCLERIIPRIKDKIIGSSVRIPTSNVSMIDLNLTFESAITTDEIFTILEKNIDPNIIEINKNRNVSTDFMTTSKPTIIDYYQTFQINEKSIKFTIWYDNEWSYCSQMIRFVNYINMKLIK
jgi:glyceraldehyde 3-phosphate dehydrogenase